MSFNPLLGGFTTLDISSPEHLVALVRWAANVLQTEEFVFLDENGRPGHAFNALRDRVPAAELERWEKHGGAGFQSVGNESRQGAVTTRRYDPKSVGYSYNSFYVSAPVEFWERDLQRVAGCLAEIVHEFDCIVGDLRLGKVKLWPGTPLAGLISVPHLTCFGSPYIELFGRAKLLSAPVFKARQHYENAVTLRLFEKLVSPESEEWRVMQQRLREHLGLRFFREPSEKPARSMSFSIQNSLKVAWFLLDIFRVSRSRRLGKSASGEPVVAPKISWDRLPAHPRAFP